MKTKRMNIVISDELDLLIREYAAKKFMKFTGVIEAGVRKFIEENK